jgi:hypothetical protein
MGTPLRNSRVKIFFSNVCIFNFFSPFFGNLRQNSFLKRKKPVAKALKRAIFCTVENLAKNQVFCFYLYNNRNRKSKIRI